jgi:hypothetical protein
MCVTSERIHPSQSRLFYLTIISASGNLKRHACMLAFKADSFKDRSASPNRAKDRLWNCKYYESIYYGAELELEMEVLFFLVSLLAVMLSTVI